MTSPQKHAADLGDFFKDALVEELSPSSHYLLVELLSVQSLKRCANSTDHFFPLHTLSALCLLGNGSFPLPPPNCIPEQIQLSRILLSKPREMRDRLLCEEAMPCYSMCPWRQLWQCLVEVKLLLLSTAQAQCWPMVSPDCGPPRPLCMLSNALASHAKVSWLLPNSFSGLLVSQ